MVKDQHEPCYRLWRVVCTYLRVSIRKVVCLLTMVKWLTGTQAACPYQHFNTCCDAVRLTVHHYLPNSAETLLSISTCPTFCLITLSNAVVRIRLVSSYTLSVQSITAGTWPHFLAHSEPHLTTAHRTELTPLQIWLIITFHSFRACPYVAQVVMQSSTLLARRTINSVFRQMSSCFGNIWLLVASSSSIFVTFTCSLFLVEISLFCGRGHLATHL